MMVRLVPPASTLGDSVPVVSEESSGKMPLQYINSFIRLDMDVNGFFSPLWRPEFSVVGFSTRFGIRDDE